MSDTDWIVRPHGPVQTLAENLWFVDAPLGNLDLHRRMVVVRGQAGGLLLHSAIALNEAGMTWLEGLGEPQVLVVPNGFHRLDAARYKARYPKLRVICPKAARTRVATKVVVDEFYGDKLPFEADESVQLAHLEGLHKREGVLRVQSADGHSLIFNDALFNLPHMPGIFGFVYGRLMGNAGGPKVTTTTRWFFMKNKKNYRAHLERLAAEPGLNRVIVAHGSLIDREPGEVLMRVAATL